MLQRALRHGSTLTLLVLGVWLGGLPQAQAAHYPITVTDLAGRHVTIDKRPQRIALQDGRDALDLALLDRQHPFRRVVVWNNLIRRFSPNFWSALAKQWPAAKKIPDMGFDDNGAVNLEEIVARRPQLVIAELRAQPVLRQSGALRTLAKAHIPVVFIDNAEHPVRGVPRSITLLGRILDRPARAKAYTTFYRRHLSQLQQKIKARDKPAPRVFMNVLAGQNDQGHALFTHGHFGWGLMVQALHAKNLGSTLINTPSGHVPTEKLIADQPDVLIMTGVARSGPLTPLGYGTHRKAIEKRLAALEKRPGFSSLHAVQQNRVYGLYHPFYSSPFNIIGLEYLAKFIYPDTFDHLNPAADYQHLIQHFTDIRSGNPILGIRAPAVVHP